MAAGVGTTLDAAAVFSPPWLLIPFCLTYAAVGAAASAEFLRAAVGVLGVLWLPICRSSGCTVRQSSRASSGTASEGCGWQLPLMNCRPWSCYYCVGIGC